MADVESEVKRLGECFEKCQVGDMKQKCIEKTIVLIETRLENQKESTMMRVELIVLKLKEEIKTIINESLDRNKKENKEQVRWGLEVVRFALYVISFLLAIKVIKG